MITVITYNVLYGFNHQKTVDSGAAWLKAQYADVVALQELNGIGQSGLSELALKWGHSYSVILKENGFPVGISSRFPIEIMEKRVDGLWHGYLYCKIQGIHFIVVHLSPFSFAYRQTEAKAICKKITEILGQNERIIVLGDFNSLSGLDADGLSKNPSFLEHCISREKEVEKIKNLNNGNFDYSVLQIFADAGMVDPYSLKLGAEGQPRGSFPTKLVDDKNSAGYVRRIDYILVGKNMTEQVKNIAPAYDAALDQISDHYPIILNLGPR